MSLILFGCDTSDNQVIEAAVEQARSSGADRVSAAGEGVPFYSVRHLDPVWSEDQAPIVRVPNLELTAQDGKTRDHRLFEDKISIVGFFFTTCRGVCPVMIERMKRIDQELKGLDQVQLVGLTVDPEHDTPEHLRKYASEMGLDVRRRWTLLTGDKGVIYRLARETFASEAFQRDPSGGERNFAHSEHFYVIDSRGRLRGVLNGSRLKVAQEVKQVVQQLRMEKQKSGVRS